MSAPPYTPPALGSDAFNCPRCQAFAHQTLKDGRYQAGVNEYPRIEGLRVTFCRRCEQPSIWHEGKLIYPSQSTAPLPNPDLPDEVKDDYEEARGILAQSPRGAAALLRLAIQKLCVHLGESGKNLNGDIASLVKKGLHVKVQQALDAVRVIGNNAVHPGQIDIKDDQKTATSLFSLVNVIADYMISQPRHVEEVYKQLPEGQREAIERRDKK